VTGDITRRFTLKYLLLLHRTEDVFPEPGTPQAAEMAAVYGKAMAAMAAAGVLLDSGPLQPRSASTMVRVRNGETLITDGPAAEIKEHIGGYTVVECADLDEALRWAAQLPAATDASVEVRPVVPVQPLA
jgi:hypothetical protein